MNGDRDIKQWLAARVASLENELAQAQRTLQRIADLGCAAVEESKRPCGACYACVASEALAEEEESDGGDGEVQLLNARIAELERRLAEAHDFKVDIGKALGVDDPDERPFVERVRELRRRLAEAEAGLLASRVLLDDANAQIDEAHIERDEAQRAFREAWERAKTAYLGADAAGEIRKAEARLDRALDLLRALETGEDGKGRGIIWVRDDGGDSEEQIHRAWVRRLTALLRETDA